MEFTRRLLQNSLPGMTGLSYLSIGRDVYQRKFATQPVEFELPGRPRLWTG